MTRIKLCGLFREDDIDIANQLLPDYVGFVFAKKSRRYVDGDRARDLRTRLLRDITAVGVFVDEDPKVISGLVSDGIIDIVQLHGSEDETYIRELRKLINAPIIKAFTVNGPKDLTAADNSTADHILLDAGQGEGKMFDHSRLISIRRPYFLAGGLTIKNVAEAVRNLRPFAVDVSSGIETDGVKDPVKMRAFVNAVRRADDNG